MIEKFYKKHRCTQAFEKIFCIDMTVPYANIENSGDHALIKYRLRYMEKQCILVGTKETLLSSLIWLKKEGIQVDFLMDIKNELSDELLEIPVIDNAILINNKLDYSQYCFISTCEENLDFLANSICMKIDLSRIVQIYNNDIRWKTFVHDGAFKQVLNYLWDYESKVTLLEILRCRLYDDLFRIPSHKSRDKYWGNGIFHSSEDEILVICGGSIGDTIFYFLEKNTKKIYVFEPERSDMLKKNLSFLPADIQSRIEVIEKFVSEKVDKETTTIDECLLGHGLSMITADVEGAELSVLHGATKSIRKHRPILSLSAYHKWDDLICFINYIQSIVPNYRFFLRKYGSIFRYNWCETVLYAVPEERYNSSIS